jgi:hypothetical protein
LLVVRIVVALVFVAACSRSTPSESELLAEAQDQTRTFFALGEGGDCERLAGMMQRPNDCKGVVQQFRETHAHLTKIESVKLDGRDKHVVLVSVEATAPEHVHHWIVRAKWTADGWKLAL